MRDFLRAGLVVVCLLLVFYQGAAAFNLSKITINPQGSLMPGTPVNITVTMDFIPVSDETFPSGSELVMSTDLDNAKWSYSLILDSAETSQPTTSGHMLAISSGILSNPSSMEEVLKITVEGNAPTVSHTSNKTLIKICEYDSHNNLNSCVERTVVVVDTCCIVPHIPEAEADLQTYRSQFDEKSALGIDTTAAEAKYSEAEQKIKSAKGRKSTQYLLTFGDLDTAKTAIGEGETALDRAWAENEVANAQIPINNVDAIIGWFKANGNTADASQLPAIIAKREDAMSYIVSANDEISNGNYELARAKAFEAFKMGNESYNDALSLRSGVRCCGFDLFHQPFFRAGVVVIVLIIIGIILWKKFPEK